MTAIIFLAPDQTARAFGPVSMSLVAMIAWFLLGRGRVEGAIHVLGFGLWAAVTATAFYTGGVHGMAIIVYPQLILILGWLIGTRAAVTMAVLAVAATLGFVLAETFQVLPLPPPTPPLMRWIVDSFIFAFSVMLIVSFVRSYQDRLKQAEELAADLRARETDLNHAQAVARIGSWVYDLRTGVMRSSAESCRIFGVPEGTTGSRETYFTRVHPDDRDALVDAWDRALATGGPFEIEHRIMVGGKVRWIRQQAEIALDAEGKPLRSVGTTQDITERRRLEELVRASDDRYRALFEGNPTPVFAVDIRTTRIIAVNQAAIEKYGYSREEILAMTLADLQVPEDRQRVADELRARYAQGAGKIEHVERRHMAKDGRVIYAEITAQPFVFDNLPARLVAVSDVTEGKRVASEILKLNAELEQRVQQRTHDLQVANRELESFAYSVSHDLRAPLRAIEGFSQLIESEFVEHLNERGQGYFKRVRSAATRMGTLIDDLLKLSRISRQEMSRRTVDLSALVRETATDLGGAEPERKVEWVIAPQVTAEGDPGLMRVALQNLIGNAWKYSSKRELARIEFAVGEKNGRPAYFVHDNGAGFDMAYADKLFGAFQRLHSPGDFPGMGIGLATVARIIHRHGGEVGAEGKIGEGATFYFTL